MNSSTPSPSLETSPAPLRSQRAAARWLIGLGLFLIAASFAAVLLTNQQSASRDQVYPPRRGQPMSNLLLTGLDGETARLDDYKGRPVLINVWATWCPPCREEMPALEAYYRQHKAEGFVLISLNAGESRDTAAEYVWANDLTFPVFIDPTQELVDGMHINNFPTSIMIGRDGLVKGIKVGSFTEEELEESITPFLE